MANSNTDTDTITLDQPIQRGEDQIKEVQVFKPNAGALRGVGLRDLLDLDVNSLIKVLPRTTTPILTEPEVASMDPADLTQLGMVLVSFLLSKGAKDKAGL